MAANPVVEQLLIANSLNNKDINDFLTELNKSNIDYADLYFQSLGYEAWTLEEGQVRTGSYSLDQGVGVRSITGESTGLAYCNQIQAAALQQAVQTVAALTATASTNPVKQCIRPVTSTQYMPCDPLHDFQRPQKIALLHHLNTFTRNLDQRVVEVRVTLQGEYEQILVAATDGTFATDIRPLVHLSITVYLEENGLRESGSASGGARTNYDYFWEIDSETGWSHAESYAYQAVKMATINLKAKPAPSGSYPVVLGSGWPAVLLHEAVGHGLEGDFNRKGSSVFTNKIGQLVTSPLCTIIDDGTLLNRRGSLNIDDEGVVTQRTVLIENGILRQYLQDKQNARLMGVESTGNGRRQSYHCLPMPRMTNTYMLAGKSEPSEIIASVEYGIYAPNFSGGQVDITSGNFVFTTSEAYLIEKGQIKHPIKKATLTGNGIEVMQNISMIGNDLKLDSGVGNCGKDGQTVPVGVGQPTIKVQQLTIGGTL